MKRLLLLPLLLLAETSLLAEDSASAPRQAVIAKLPAFSSEQHDRAVAEQAAIAAARAAAQAAAAADPELFVLPDRSVIEKALQRMEEDSLYQRGAYDKELVKRELSAFDRSFLNRYTLALPFGGVSIGVIGTKTLEERARAEYLQRKKRLYKERITRLSRLIATEDSSEGRALRRDLRNEPTTGQPITYDPRPVNHR